MKLFFTIFMFFTFDSFGSTIISPPEIKFTGYKFTKKVGVQGSFDKVDWSFHRNSKNLVTILKSARIKIDSHSINSGAKDRDKNITQALFKTWGARYIEAKVIKVQKNAQTLIAEINIGKRTQQVKMKYSQTANRLIISGSIDLIKMGFNSSFKKLVKTCQKLHTGPDGISKTWSVVDIEVSGSLKN